MNIIKDVRKELGYSQEYMAYRMSKTLKTYALKEKEPKRFYFEELKLICKILDLNVNEVAIWILSTLEN